MRVRRRMFEGRPYLLIGDSFSSFTHQLLNIVEIHLFVDLLQHLISLLKAKKYIFFNQREFDRRYLDENPR